MSLIIPHSLKKSELFPNGELADIEIIKEAARKAEGGIGTTIKASLKLRATTLKKLSLTSSHGAGRVIFLLQIKEKKNSILLMLRSKNDKEIGENMTIANKKFKKVLEKNIDLMLKDLEKRNYEEIPLE